MKFSTVELPSNKKFGFFFTVFFLILAGFFYARSSFILAFMFSGTSVCFCLVTMANAHFLLPLNKLWMRIGLLLGMIVSPIVLGLVFFGMFTPVAVILRIWGRDELRLAFKPKSSYWIERDEPIRTDSFINQF
jgi:hypothetical protein